MSWRIAHTSILRASTVTITSSDGAYPLYRLYDGKFGRHWKATGTATQTLLVDQGVSPVAVNVLAIPSGHNLSGCALSWQYSADSSTWVDCCGGWTQSGSAQIVRRATVGGLDLELEDPITARYWRLVISGAASAPYCAEVFMGLYVTMPDPLEGSRWGKTRFVTRLEGLSGTPFYLKRGSAKHSRELVFQNIDSSDMALFTAWFDAHDLYLPFLIEDHLGNTFFAEILEEPMPSETATGLVGFQIRIRQAGP